WAGDKAGILPTVSQQVQPDRALLGCAGAEVGRGAAERPEGDPATGATDDLAGAPPGGKEAAGRLPRRGASEPGTDEALRGAPPEVPDPPQVRYHHHAAARRPAGWLRHAGRLVARINALLSADGVAWAGPASPEAIARVEAALGVRFPASFRSLLLLTGGG